MIETFSIKVPATSAVDYKGRTITQAKLEAARLSGALVPVADLKLVVLDVFREPDTYTEMYFTQEGSTPDDFKVIAHTRTVTNPDPQMYFTVEYDHDRQAERVAPAR